MRPLLILCRLPAKQGWPPAATVHRARAMVEGMGSTVVTTSKSVAAGHDQSTLRHDHKRATLRTSEYFLLKFKPELQMAYFSNHQIFRKFVSTRSLFCQFPHEKGFAKVEAA